VGTVRPATFKSNALEMRNADRRSGVTPSLLRHQLKAYTCPGYSLGKASTTPTRLILSGSPSVALASDARTREGERYGNKIPKKKIDWILAHSTFNFRIPMELFHTFNIKH